MTAAPNSPLNLRLALAGLGTAISLLFGVLTLRAFGLGPALFLFALAAVGIVDLVVILRRRGERARVHAGAGRRRAGPAASWHHRPQHPPVAGHDPGMQLPVMPPVKPMPAKGAPEVPDGDDLYEPQWDGSRQV